MLSFSSIYGVQVKSLPDGANNPVSRRFLNIICQWFQWRYLWKFNITLHRHQPLILQCWIVILRCWLMAPPKFWYFVYTSLLENNKLNQNRQISCIPIIEPFWTGPRLGKNSSMVLVRWIHYQFFSYLRNRINTEGGKALRSSAH